MTDAPEVEIDPSAPESSGEIAVPVRQRSPLRRIGCGCVLTLWFLLLLTPCALVYLATRGEITISTGSVPGQELRVWLMTEERDRGIGISTASVAGGNGTTDICLQTDVRYVLWAGRGENTTYCDCYARANANASWTSAAATVQGACRAR